MKLQIFREKNKKQLGIIIGIGFIVLLVAGILVYRSFALYHEKKEFNIISGTVPELHDINYTYYLAGATGERELIDQVPEERNYTVSIVCNNAQGNWDYEAWSPVISDREGELTKCDVVFTSHYHEDILNGADPVLANQLIPVTISDGGVVKKASLTSEWYSYEKKNWANAVILEDESIIYQDNEEIPESNIESYFVWIPRYRYKIFNDGNYTELSNVEESVQTIEIEFESKDKSVSNGSVVGEWLTHPAFTSFDVNGIWVGKFETGYKGATVASEAEKNVIDTEKVQIKSNVYSWRNIQVANAFYTTYDYKRNLDSHMMKNTEWGAVAYLQHSAYGSQTSVRINNNSSYITGYAAKDEPTCGFIGDSQDCNVYEGTNLGADGLNTFNYKNSLSVVASTTGNYSGIYDMSGGVWEYVMGVLTDENNALVSGRNEANHSNFIGTLTNGTSGSKTNWSEEDGGLSFPDNKYFDKYEYGDYSNGEGVRQYKRRILGDATGELGAFANVTYGTQNRQLGSWYKDEAWFVHRYDPWFVRGGAAEYGLGSGVFSFGAQSGGVEYPVSFRVVLAF